MLDLWSQSSQMTIITRRHFAATLGGAVAWPLAAKAQQQLPVVGILSSRSFWESQYLINAFWNGLNETGYAENRNVAIEYRWAEGQYDRLRKLGRSRPPASERTGRER